jgi:hypothetical protein
MNRCYTTVIKERENRTRLHIIMKNPTSPVLEVETHQCSSVSMANYRTNADLLGSQTDDAANPSRKGVLSGFNTQKMALLDHVVILSNHIIDHDNQQKSETSPQHTLKETFAMTKTLEWLIFSAKRKP